MKNDPNPPKKNDAACMAEFQNGSEAAFEILFDRYAAHLINFFNRFLNSSAESEDLAQEVLLRIYKFKVRYDPARPFKPWVFSIAARLASNRLRDKKRRFAESLDQAPEAASIFKDKISTRPDSKAEEADIRRCVREALDALPENQKIAVLLSRFEDLSYAEIAQSMDISESAVKSLLFRARETLKETLAPLL